jgi:hypothetical protein
VIDHLFDVREIVSVRELQEIHPMR